MVGGLEIEGRDVLLASKEVGSSVAEDHLRPSERVGVVVQHLLSRVDMINISSDGGIALCERSSHDMTESHFRQNVEALESSELFIDVIIQTIQGRVNLNFIVV